jgi:hypothetical protein
MDRAVLSVATDNRAYRKLSPQISASDPAGPSDESPSGNSHSFGGIRTRGSYAAICSIKFGSSLGARELFTRLDTGHTCK